MRLGNSEWVCDFRDGQRLLVMLWSWLWPADNSLLQSSVVRGEESTKCEMIFRSPAALPLQSCGAAGISLCPGSGPPAGSQLCQRRPTAQCCFNALAQLRRTPFSLKVPASTKWCGKRCIVGEWCEYKQRKKEMLYESVCIQTYWYPPPPFHLFQSSSSLLLCLRGKLMETCRKKGRILESRHNKKEQGYKTTPGTSFKGRLTSW